jgi:hypothetical protein
MAVERLPFGDMMTATAMTTAVPKAHMHRALFYCILSSETQMYYTGMNHCYVLVTRQSRYCDLAWQARLVVLVKIVVHGQCCWSNGHMMLPSFGMFTFRPRIQISLRLSS